MVRLKTILKKYLLKENVRKVYNYYYKKIYTILILIFSIHQ